MNAYGRPVELRELTYLCGQIGGTLFCPDFQNLGPKLRQVIKRTELLACLCCFICAELLQVSLSLLGPELVLPCFFVVESKCVLCVPVAQLDRAAAF